MFRIRRVPLVVVLCLLMISLTFTAAFAAAVNPYPANSPLHAYWEKYYGSGSATTVTPTTPTTPTTPATPATPTTPTTPATSAAQDNPMAAYWNKYYGGKYTGTPTTPTTPTTPETPTTPTTPETPPADQGSSVLSADEKLMLDLVNQERAKAGLKAFTVDAKLVELARMKSQDMYQKNYFSHTSPTYGSALDMEKKAGVSYRIMGAENIAKAATTQRAHELFMGSEGHRSNIMNSAHTTIGIGIVKTPNGVVVTQLFAGS